MKASLLETEPVATPMTRPQRLTRYAGERRSLHLDTLATEEPLEIRVVFEAEGARQKRSVAITMRTPGDDAELALGFLFGEALIDAAADVVRVEGCGPALGAPPVQNIVRVTLAPGVTVAPASLDRAFVTSSSCGLCGKATLAALEQRQVHAITPGPCVEPALLYGLPEALRQAQPAFDATGGLHAAALFDADGRRLALREDVGRHNALDKLIGWALGANLLPLSDCLVLVSGRASFELVQKARRAGVPLLAAVGAPSSLAVSAAERFGMTLIGFLRDRRFNLYAGGERVVEDSRDRAGPHAAV